MFDFNITGLMEKSGNCFFIKNQLCSMKDSKLRIDFRSCHVAMCRNGGMMAFVNKSNIKILDSSNILYDKIKIYNQNATNDKTIMVCTCTHFYINSFNLIKGQNASFTLISQKKKSSIAFCIMDVLLNSMCSPHTVKLKRLIQVSLMIQ